MPKDWGGKPSCAPRREIQPEESFSDIANSDDNVCPTCDGTGMDNGHLCKGCGGTGYI